MNLKEKVRNRYYISELLLGLLYRVAKLETSSVTEEEVYEIINATSITLPTYASNAAAVTGGLAIGRLYKTATGEVRIRI